MFVDEVKVNVRAGRGGNGVTAFARQPYEPRGRPEGGDGGHGGSVIVRATLDAATLVDYHHRPHRRAGSGKHGEGDLRRGGDGADEILLVPVGTVVKIQDGEVIGDLLEPGAEVVAARGGRGGRGNAAFRTSARRAPRFHEFGEPGEERWVVLELKLVADVALVGFPNAGKSSLVARLSAARPKIAGYPFTTLSPNLGVVQADDVDFVVADVPGLIEGASAGRGLGHRFLRHVERAGVLVHVLDAASYERRDPVVDLETVLGELHAYDPSLLERPALVFVNKADADPDVAELTALALRERGWEAIPGSAVTGQSLDVLRHRLAALVTLARAQREPDEQAADRPVLRPAKAAVDFVVERTADGFRVSGERIERWVVMADLDNEEAVRYLQGRLARAGVERQLAAAGARRGDAVEIAGAVFDFEPDTDEAVPPEDADVLASDHDDPPGQGPQDQDHG